MLNTSHRRVQVNRKSKHHFMKRQSTESLQGRQSRESSVRNRGLVALASGCLSIIVTKIGVSSRRRTSEIYRLKDKKFNHTCLTIR
jgi:hypothetical protein